MKSNIPVQLKAAFLLIVFFTNTSIGFACAVVVNMEFTTKHRGKIEMEITPKDTDAGKDHKSKGCKDHRCNNHVIKFSKVNKSFPERFSRFKILFVTTLISSFYYINVLHPSISSANLKYFARNYPPLQDTRITIQSFQI